jgi:hypothetical protein
MRGTKLTTKGFPAAVGLLVGLLLQAGNAVAFSFAGAQFDLDLQIDVVNPGGTVQDWEGHDVLAATFDGFGYQLDNYRAPSLSDGFNTPNLLYGGYATESIIPGGVHLSFIIDQVDWPAPILANALDPDGWIYFTIDGLVSDAGTPFAVSNVELSDDAFYYTTDYVEWGNGTAGDPYGMTAYFDTLDFIGYRNPSELWVEFDVTAVPVPAAVWLFGSGLLGLAGVARRRNA